jgi:gamma-glutamyltranspeptidase/glutathione hydrolase
MKKGLKARGHEVKVVPLNSGLHAIRRKNGRYLGGADPRREGLVLSQ